MKKIFPKIILFLFILLIYFLPSLIFKTDEVFYKSLNGVKLPMIAFPIVWSFIYICMSLYIVLLIKHVNENVVNKKELRILVFFLILNYIVSSAFTYVFFTAHNLFASYIITLATFVTIVLVTLQTLLINKKLALLNIPYVIWSIIASVLAILIYLQN